MQRRRFLEWATAGLTAATTTLVSIPFVQYLLSALRPPEQKTVVLLDDVNELRPGVPLPVDYQVERKDGWVVTNEVRKAFVVTDRQGQILVLSNVCPHAQCTVDLQTVAGRQAFVCPCHDGRFDLRGKVIAGPPPSGLERLKSKRKGTRLLIEVEA